MHIFHPEVHPQYRPPLTEDQMLLAKEEAREEEEHREEERQKEKEKRKRRRKRIKMGLDPDLNSSQDELSDIDRVGDSLIDPDAEV